MIHTLGVALRQQFGCKVYKLSLSGGMTCPNRDGTLGQRGCIFCSGAGEFAEAGEDMNGQLQRAKARVASKMGSGGKYIAYFQSFTNTYAPVERLEALFSAAIQPEDVVALSVATRPDCLSPDVLSLLARLAKRKPLFVELGLQTIHPQTAAYIRRGYDLSIFEKAVRALKEIGAQVVVHMIVGLPGETRDMAVETARYIGDCGAEGIKIHLLHVLRGTDLEQEYLAGNVPQLTMEEYIETVVACIKNLPPQMVIHRMTGDGDKRTLVAPLWSADKKTVLNALNRALQNVEQGEAR